VIHTAASAAAAAGETDDQRDRQMCAGGSTLKNSISAKDVQTSKKERKTSHLRILMLF
jgi:hypothetical protein